MDKIYFDSDYRLQEYRYLLRAEREDFPDGSEEMPAGRTISELSRLTGLPVSVVRADVVAMLENDFLAPFDDAVEFDESMAGGIARGAWDDTLLTLSGWDNYYGQPFVLPLNREEYLAYMLYKRDYGNHRTTMLHVKDCYRSFGYENLLTDLDKVSGAIRNKQDVVLFYMKESGKRESVRIRPMRIVYDAMDNAFAVATVNEEGKVDLYPFEKGMLPRAVRRTGAWPDPAPLSILEHLWGITDTEGPFHVQVRFFNEGNVHQKIRRSIPQKDADKLYEKDGFLYYENKTVYGYGAFRTWILGYGASAQVLKPQKLRDDILEEMEKMMKT